MYIAVMRALNSNYRRDLASPPPLLRLFVSTRHRGGDDERSGPNKARDCHVDTVGANEKSQGGRLLLPTTRV
jgi:hypothetical protein